MRGRILLGAIGAYMAVSWVAYYIWDGTFSITAFVFSAAFMAGGKWGPYATILILIMIPMAAMVMHLFTLLGVI